ncbi:MAG TPA: DNA polymerase III subunit alpha [Candidatus Polarisedimenticolaceae bacterium]|nr:DNA polymerase III subunit alpha [Candidatus Polarisedimenticolaceae bacterium]
MPERTPDFVHLHNHTTYSLLDGAQRLDEMLARAAEDGQRAIAITDHGNLFGVLEFAREARKRSIRPIIGIEAYVAPGSRHDRGSAQAGGGRQKPYHHLILLAESYAGYKNLIRLASAGFLEGFYYRPRIDKELLRAHGEGLICLSACLAGEVPTLLRADRYEEARAAAGEFRELFGRDRYWLEIQDHGLEEQKKVNDGAARLASELGIDLVATNDCHYLLPSDHFAHDVLVCIQTSKTVHSHDRIRYSPQHYLKSRAEMGELFAWAPAAVANTAAIAERCGFSFEKQPHQLPNFPVPEGYDLDGYFEKVVRDGFETRVPRWRAESDAGRLRHPIDVYRDRLDREIRMIRDMGFAGYFLIVWDFIRFSREQGIPVGPGRGSAAGSLVAYCMRITDIDPMQFDLLFERFLNPERVSLPDIDIDFCFRNRERVIDYVTGKYGRPNVAQIITFGTMAARAVIRDAGRGLDIPYAEVDKIAKLVPQQPGQEITIAKALEEVPALRTAYEADPQVRQLIDVGQRLEGLVRHASTHAAGVVIAPKPIVEFAPLYRGTDEAVTTQFAMSDIEEIGLLKMDFLGLKTLTLIADAEASIAAATGARPDIDGLTLDDPAVYDLFGRARTAGIFQFESEGMKNILRRLKPDRFEDLVAINALYRPGPIGGGLIDDFIKRRHGKVRVEYPHPLLEEVLRETYGVIVYQEQVMQIASAMAGYSLGEADILRRAMGKKQKDAMAAEREKFIQRARGQGIRADDAGKVFDLMEYFAGYGFNKSHSAAYALVAYRTAWLKAHHPVHFMAALLTTEKGNTDKLVQYVNESREMGIPVLPPDVCSSSLDFTPDAASVRFGLSAIKNVGEGAIVSILEARERLGRRFRSLFELAAEIDLRLANKRVLEALVQSGALDTLGGRRSAMMAAVDAALEWGQKRRTDRESGQGSLFGGASSERGSADAPEGSLPELPDWDERTRLDYEKATLGFYVSGHPLESLRGLLDDFATHGTADLRGLASGAEVSVGGMVGELRKRKSKKGAWWAAFQLEDLAGQVEVLAFPKTFEQSQAILENGRAVLVTGRVESEDGRVRLTADEVAPLDALRETKAEAVQVRLDAAEVDDDLLARLRAAVEAHRGEVALYLEIVRSGEFRVVARAEPTLRVAPSPRLSAAIEGVVGPGRLRYRARTAKGSAERPA